MDPFIGQINIVHLSSDFDDVNLNFEEIKQDNSLANGKTIDSAFEDFGKAPRGW